MPRKDRVFLIFSFVLAVLVGGAKAMSVPPSSVNLTVHQFLNVKKSEVFEVQVPTHYAGDFLRLLSREPDVLTFRSVGSRHYTIPPGEYEYILLRSDQIKKLKPYVQQFLQGFLFVAMFYFVIRYLIQTLVIKEYKQSLNRKKKKKRTRKRSL